MVVCNHVGWNEILTLICSPLYPSFTPKIEYAKIPLLNGWCLGLQSMFVKRTKADERDLMLKQITDRQTQISDELSDF